MPDVPSRPELLFHIALRASHRQVAMRDELTSVLKARGFSHKQAKEEASSLTGPMKETLDTHIATFEGRRLKTYYQRSQNDPDVIVPSQNAGAFKWTADVQLALMDMKPREFEILLGNVLRRMECMQVAVTQPTRDGGFDVIGRIDLERQVCATSPLSGPSLLAGQSVYLFGEAKKYQLAKPVQVKDVQALVGSISTLKGGGGTATIDRMRGALEEWGWNQNAPVIPFFGTSGRYRASIHGLARKQCYSILDGEQLAQRVLILYPNVRSVADVSRAVRELCSGPFDNVSILPRGTK